MQTEPITLHEGLEREVSNPLMTQLDRYFFADLAAGKLRSKNIASARARQAIVGVGIDYLRRIFVICAWAGRLPATGLKDKIISVYDQYRPKQFGIEANAMQELFGSMVRDEANAKFGRVPILPVYQNTKVDKLYRIRNSVQPVISEGRLFIMEDQYELREEIAGFPTAQTMDLVDALSSALAMIPKRAVGGQQGDLEEKKLAQYLRNSGVSAHEIERRIENYRLRKAS